MAKSSLENSDRRNFLFTTAAAAVAGFTLAEAPLFAEPALVQGEAASGSANFQLFTSEHLEDDIKAMQSAPANKNLIENKNFVVMLTVEKEKSAKEFEYHEGRDHVFYVLDGSTTYEVGGTPKNGRSIRPGEWLAPESEGATTLKLKKGDMLIIPRGTPHKRSTEGSVTLILVSPMGTASS